MKPIIVSSGEPAGVGPEICLALAKMKLPIVVVGDFNLINDRKRMSNAATQLVHWVPDQKLPPLDGMTLPIYHHPLSEPVVPGQLNPKNSSYVLDLIRMSTQLCLTGEAAALVTAPVHKAVINDAGIPFSGHTEFLASLCDVKQVVMMLACDKIRVALATTHIPINHVSRVLTEDRLSSVIDILNHALKTQWGIAKPNIVVTGLNPHAGEQGYIGHEEIDVISPVIKHKRNQEMDIIGPVPADTAFCSPEFANADVFLTMYHDQGLPVVKYAGFHQTANITLGLPIIRTSVDHGTALLLAGDGSASSDSLCYATQYAWTLINQKAKRQS